MLDQRNLRFHAQSFRKKARNADNQLRMKPEQLLRSILIRLLLQKYLIDRMSECLILKIF